jgi:cytidine deaminase
MESFQYEVTGQFIEDESELTAPEKELMQHAVEAMERAYAPYSNFRVGAALRLASGIVVTGNNQENAAYPSGLCAERVAFFAAGANYPGVPVTDVALVASSDRFELSYPVAPCGACRQVMLEYELNQDSEINLLFRGKTGRMVRLRGIRQLLPFFFHETSLRNDQGNNS